MDSSVTLLSLPPISLSEHLLGELGSVYIHCTMLAGPISTGYGPHRAGTTQSIAATGTTN